jgi:cytochrome c-type biogenesis protein CcmF
VVAIGGSLRLYAWRAPLMQGGGAFAPVSREGGLVLNNLLLATATATVLLGTLYPLFLDAVGGRKISVGAPFFDATFVPLMVPLFLALPIGSMLAWKRGDLPGVLGRLRAVFAVTAAAILLHLALSDTRSILAALGLGLGVWVVAGPLNELAQRLGLFQVSADRVLHRARGLPRSAWAATVAHVGVGVLIIGITISSTGKSERILVMRAGDTVELAGYQVAFHGVTEAQGPNYGAQRGAFTVTTDDGAPVAELASEKRFFPVERNNTTEAGIDTTPLRDIYLVLGDQADGQAGAWTVRLYHNPLVTWIWGGAVIMALGGLISLTDRRLRVGVPRPARARAVAPAAPAPAGA